MQMRSKVLMGLITAAMLIAGVAWAGSGDPEDAVPVTVIPVDEAGTVSLGQVEAGLSILAVEPKPGWTVTVEVPLGREVEARFESDGARVDFEAELEDGEVRLTVERLAAGATSSSTSTTFTTDLDSTTSTSEASTSTTQGTTPSTSPTSTSSTKVTTPSTSTTVESTSTSQATTSTTEGTTSTTIDDNDDVVSIPDGVKTLPVDAAGSVTIEIRSGRLNLVSVDANGGWSYEVDKAEGDDIRVEFESDSDTEAELRVRIKDGRLEVETRSD
ncbi:MAG TPA: hypothetical protein VHL52_13610 [Acidimicrobiia bacterium]|nr:hypothetical protein [Acidimicrobiia bacterium]